MRKPPSSRTSDGESLSPSPVLREVTTLPGVGETISVRAAKAHLSALLNLVEGGREITITSGGRPKARMVQPGKKDPRVPFTGTREHLATMPPWRGGPTGEEIIRADRDSKGW